MLGLILNYILVFVSSFLAGRGINNYNIKDRSYYIRFLFPLLSVSVILGARFGWATDYMNYFNVYQNIDSYSYEPIFQLINSTLHLFRAPFPIAFGMYAFLCYLGALYLFSKFKGVVAIAFPIFICLYFYDSSNLVRFTTAIFFVLCAIRCIIYDDNRRNYLSFFAFSLLAVLTHTGTIMLILILLLIPLMKFLDNKYIAITLFIISCFLSADLFVGAISDFISYISVYSDKLGDLSIARYFTNDNIKEQYFDSVRFNTFYNTGKALYVYILQIIYMFSVIFCGNVILTNYNIKGFRFLYRLSVLAAIMYIPFYGNELMMRVCSFMMAISSIVVAYSFRFFYKINSNSFKIFVVLMGISFIYIYIFMVIKNLMQNFNIIYIWNMI